MQRCPSQYCFHFRGTGQQLHPLPRHQTHPQWKNFLLSVTFETLPLWCCHPMEFSSFNVLKNEIIRVTRNRSGVQEVMAGQDFISKRFESNGYPRSAIRRAIYEVDHPLQKITPKKPNVFLCLPFMGEKRAGEIRRSLKKCGLSDFLSVSFKSYTLSSVLRPRRSSFCFVNNCKFCLIAKNEEDCCSKNVVYFIECCHCSATYVGETKRTMRSRLREHVSSPTSHVFHHLTENHSSADLDDIRWSILHSGVARYDVRRRLEFYEIRSRNPLLNVQLA